MTKLSVITINYNNKEGLKKTIESVVTQSWQDFEYLIIDGGSTDGSLDVIKEYQDKITYWVSEPDKGIYNAMNKGILKASAEYLLFLNSGDQFYDENSLSSFIPYLNEDVRKDIIFGNILVKGSSTRITSFPEKLSFSYLKKQSLPHPASLIKKSCFNDFLYDETLKIVSDWKFFIVGICKKKFSYLHINNIISIFYLDGISSNNCELQKKEEMIVLEQEFNLFLEDYKKYDMLKSIQKESIYYQIKFLLIKFYKKLKK